VSVRRIPLMLTRATLPWSTAVDVTRIARISKRRELVV
jgi:hypothetical protein